jgi:hypothetical protein
MTLVGGRGLLFWLFTVGLASLTRTVVDDVRDDYFTPSHLSPDSGFARDELFGMLDAAQADGIDGLNQAAEDIMRELRSTTAKLNTLSDGEMISIIRRWQAIR